MTKTQKWNEIHRGSKITLAEDKTLKSFNGEPREVKAGQYYITGFWVDIVGLSKESGDSANDICIQSRELVNFNNITN